MRWYQDRATLALIALRYVPWLAGLNLLWEMAHLPLYTLWKEETFGYMAFAVAHCTAGDVLIGLSALAASLTVLRADAAPNWRWLDITAVTVFTGTTYTLFSEWLNIRVLESWSYSNLMPVLELGGTEIGISPLLQWIVVPTVVLQLTRREFASCRAS